MADNMDQSDISSIKDVGNVRSPLSIFIILSFICLVWVIIHKSATNVFPSLSEICLITVFVIVCSAALIILGQVSYTLEWSCMIISTLILFLGTFSILRPDIILYQ